MKFLGLLQFIIVSARIETFMLKKNLYSGCLGLFLSSFIVLCLLAQERVWGSTDSFSFWGDIAFFRRSEGSRHWLIIDSSQGTLNSCGGCIFKHCSSETLVKRFNYEPGFEVGVAYATCRTILEALYLEVREWKSRCFKKSTGLISFSGEGRLGLPQGFFNADQGGAQYKEHFQNGELNYYQFFDQRQGNPFSVAWLVGGRYMGLRDRLSVEFYKNLVLSRYSVDTKNRIGALQIGGFLGWNSTSRIHLDFKAKVGLCFDWDHKRRVVTSSQNTDVSGGGFSLPFLAGVGLSLGYQAARWLNTHIAYQVIYLNGITLAPNVMNGDSSGVALFHGWTGGLGISF